MQNRKQHQTIFIQLYQAKHMQPPPDISFSDFNLLTEIEKLLIYFDCMPFTKQEFNKILGYEADRETAVNGH